jgi:hypothetical protein
MSNLMMFFFQPSGWIACSLDLMVILTCMFFMVKAVLRWVLK